MPPSSKSQNIEISLPNQVGYERIAMACSESFAKMLGLSPERIEDLKTIVAEAAINAVQHGNKERPDARVFVSMTFMTLKESSTSWTRRWGLAHF
jgi:anti-sigma regulatory factor (Ser/Thr protein kinase)